MASSIPHHYYSSSDYSTELCGASNMLDNNGALVNVNVPLLNYDINSPVSVASFPDQYFRVSDCMVIPQMSEIEMGLRDFYVSCDNYQHHQVFEPGEDCTGSVPHFLWPPYNPMAYENWAIEGKPVTKMEETEVKVGRYSVEERKDRILRYLKKRNQRNFNKTIKYACRKTLADKRVRVRGRFAKNNEPCEEEISMNTNHQTSYHQQNNLFYDDSFHEMKYDEDYWLQAAMDNLVHLPYLAS